MTIEKTKDYEIRQALLVSSYIQALREEDEHTLVMQEYALSTEETRIDLAIFNGHFHGFEIKSDKDTLERLPNQAHSYSKIFEYLYLVVGVKHIEKAAVMLPTYWGIYSAEKKNNITQLNEVRPSSRNENQDAFAVASMLWKSEALSLLDKYNLLKGYKSKPCRALWTCLSMELPFKTLEEEVRFLVKIRGDWRVDLQRRRDGAMSRRSAML